MTLSAEDICYTTRTGEQLLSDVTLALEPGSVTGILGPNGAGKSTLLKILSRELSPTKGAVILDSQELHHIDRKSLARRIAVLSQSSSIGFPYPVIDVVILGRIPHIGRSSSATDREIAWQCLKEVEISHLAGRLYTTLSGGEKQRVQLARVLAQLYGTESDFSAKILLLDEPTSALDLSHQHQVLRLAGTLAKRGAAVMVVLHDLNLAAQYTDYLHVLNRGRCVTRGVVSEVLQPCMIHDVYGVEAFVEAHPILNCPLIYTRGREGGS